MDHWSCTGNRVGRVCGTASPTFPFGEWGLVLLAQGPFSSTFYMQNRCFNEAKNHIDLNKIRCCFSFIAANNRKVNKYK